MPRTSTTARPSPTSTRASVTRGRLASGRLASAVDSPRMAYRTSSSMPGSRSARCPRRSLPRRGPAPRVPCCFPLLSRPPSSRDRGRPEFRSRST
jgi:hypothetical protein